jgi:putative ABC transport system permease protein
MMRLPLRIIRAVTPAVHREFVVGDTLERAAEIGRVDGEHAASRWLWREMWRVIVHAPRHRWSVRAPRSSRSATREGLLGSFWYDVRYALRGFRRTPGMTAITVLTLALGLGATTAIFSVVNAVLLKPLPYAEPERLVRILENVPAEESFGAGAQQRTTLNVAELDDWRKSRTLSHVAIVGGLEGHTLTTPAGAVVIYGARVSPALFAMRGVQPLLGRGLTQEEERADAEVIVLGQSLWQEQFGGDPNIVGRTLVLDGRVLTIVGVMPREFGAGGYWTPYVAPPPGPGITSMAMSAQLAEGVSLEAASAEINTIGLALRGITPGPDAAPRFEIVRELDQIIAPVLPALRVLVVAVAAVLLIVCINVANLVLVRGTQRQQEIAIRRSLGAARGRIIRLVFVESLTLAAIAGVVAIVLAFSLVQLVQFAASVNLPLRFSLGATAILPRIEELSVGPLALAFVGAAVVLVGALIGVLPAVRLSRFGERGRSPAAEVSVAVGTTRVGYLLATAQLGFAMALLIGAGLLMHSFLKLATVDPGFDARGVLNFELVVPAGATAERKLEVAQALTSRLQDHPRVIAAGFTDIPPLAGNLVISMGSFTPDGMSAPEMMEAESRLPPPRTQTRIASSGYLRALGAQLAAGVWLEDEPSPDSSTVLVSREYAQAYFPGRSAVGATLRRNNREATIVGVVDDIHLRNLEGAPERVVFIEPGQFLSALRATPSRPPPPGLLAGFLTVGSRSLNAIMFAARTDGDPLAIVPDLRAMVRDVDPALAVDAVIPMDAVLSGITTRPRFYATLLSAFGAIAGFIAVIGIYGALAYLVSQRTKEIGIRMALGARRANVLRLVLRRGLVIVAIGVTSGLLGALGLTRYLEGMLYGITALDATTYGVVAVAFASVALFASYLPARRATRIDPIAALRHD